ncbi:MULTISPECIES: PEP-CTERM sorting domain-containing protein [unclassified Methylophilus]|jgi:hypothetical protein|uniref:PEP-CTERM sorting domain-containing protein n=1 Tax=unclassified Methylophilus TaxID=2630143 RepID=UPI0003696BFB|nr:MULTISPECIES: PEP-CTERM sorting domain-containing protein [unclassified Methylophilus]
MSVVTKTLCAVAVCGALSAPAQSAVIFSDNFDSYTAGLNVTDFAGNWTVTNGTVDVIGNGYFDFYPGNGLYIDLDGSTSDAGDFSSKALNVAAGTYTLEFVLSGSTRGESNTVDVSFGSYNETFNLTSDAPVTIYTRTVNFASNSLASVVFKNGGGDNMGALLLNVSVASVPEAETAAMMLAGLGIMGSIVRRRKST